MSKQTVYQKINTYVKSNYQLMNFNDFVLGDIPYNHRCHLNSVQKVRESKAIKVILCFVIEKDSTFQCVHFINQLENGKYQDNTWGWLYETYDYYFIREVTDVEQSKVWTLLQDTKKSLINLHSNWLERLIYGVSPNDI